MKSSLNPYLSFKGNAREAMEFYKSVFGGMTDAVHAPLMPYTEPIEIDMLPDILPPS